MNEPTEEGMPEGMTAEQRKALLETVKQFSAEKPSEQKTISGSEAVGPVGTTNKGSDVNWDEYDIPFALKERYKEAIYRETPQGPKWVVMQDEFDSSTREWGAKGAAPRKDGTHPNLGTFLNEMLNDGKGWRAIAIQPVSGQAGVLLQRQVPYILPDPVRLQQDTEVAAPSDPELAAAEDAALSFMQSEGLKASDALAGEDFGDPATVDTFVERSKGDASTLEKFHVEGEN